MITLFVVMGSVGWSEFAERSKFWIRNRRLSSVAWGFFWVLNTILLLFFTFTYSKRARVEAMTFLSKYDNIRAITVLDNANDPEMMPKFYLNQWPASHNEYPGDHSVDSILNEAVKPVNIAPRFILFTSDVSIQPMVIKARRYFPGIVYETTIEPGYMDQIVHWLNPINKNRRIFIYRNTAFFAKKSEN
jgi:hypothetical protein